MWVVLVIAAGVALAATAKRSRSGGASARRPVSLAPAGGSRSVGGVRNVPRPPRFPGPWPLPAPTWIVARPPEGNDLLLPSVIARTALREGYRLFPALVAGRNRADVFEPGGGGRDVWERGDPGIALAAAKILFDASEAASPGALADALASGAAGLDSAAVAVLLAQGLVVNESDEFFDRMRAGNAAYDERMRRINEDGMEAFESGNWIAFAGYIFEGGWALLEGTYAGIQAVFDGSHGGGPAISVPLVWTARAADAYAHRGYLAARAAGLVP